MAVAVDEDQGFLRSFQAANTRVPTPSRISSMKGIGSGTTRLTRKSTANNPNSLGKLRRPTQRMNGATSGFGMYCRSEEHTSELKSLIRFTYAVFCLKQTKQ